MAVRIHDPGHVGLRRGLRAAIAMPLGIVITLFLLDEPVGALFTVFGTVGLLINADFAGRTVDRLSSYLLTGVFGSLTLSIGFWASFNTPVAVIVTFVIAFVLAFANLARGRIAVATPALLLLFVVAVSVESTTTALPHYLTGWWVAVVVSTATALLILPTNQLTGERAALGRTFIAAAHGIQRTWLGTPGDGQPFDEFDEAVMQLNLSYGGSPYRTSGITRRDQSLTLLVAMVNSVRLLMISTRSSRPATQPSPARDALATAVVAGLEDLSTAMNDPTYLPSAAAIDARREQIMGIVEERVLTESRRGDAPADISARIGLDHLLRMVALFVEQLIEVTRLANHGATEDLQREPPIPMITTRAVIRAQLSLQSPWMRNALRSALGLSIAVLIVNLTGVEHGFWVLIGVISILRFDAIGTRRFAVQAIVGTVAGVVIALVVLFIARDTLAVMWILLPIAVFIAAWSGIALNYAIGQAAFSALILIAFGILDYPPKAVTGAIRIEDILLGAGVAVVVGLLMWPRGAVGYLRLQLAAALRAGADFLNTAIVSFDDSVDDHLVEAKRVEAASAAQRAAETYDVALMQRGPAEDMRPWTTSAVSAYLLVSTGRVVHQLLSTAPGARTHPQLSTALTDTAAATLAHWNAVATGVQSGDPTIVGDATEVPYPVLPSVTDAQDAHALVVSVWIVDWIRHLDRLSTTPTAGSVPPTTATSPLA